MNHPIFKPKVGPDVSIWFERYNLVDKFMKNICIGLHESLEKHIYCNNNGERLFLIKHKNRYIYINNILILSKLESMLNNDNGKIKEYLGIWLIKNTNFPCYNLWCTVRFDCD